MSRRRSIVRFGAFEYRPSEASLLKNGKVVRIGSRALSLLDTLLKTPGEYVPYELLTATTWPGIVVEESNLRVQMNALRRALDGNKSQQSQVVNAVGRGYALRTAVQVIELEDLSLVAARTASASGAGKIPTPLTRLVGRELDVDDMLKLLAQGPVLTVVGPGGIGKTRVAWAAALAAVQRDKIRGLSADLSSLQRDGSVLGVVASALEVDDTPSMSLEAKVVEALAAQATLLVLDNCEHVVEGAAWLVEFLARSVPSLHVIATSREPLRCEGERVFRLSGLTIPGSGVPLSAASALQFTSIELLVEWACTADRSFVVGDTDVVALTELCRRLDGIPLAIELAAAQLGVLGLSDLAEGIDRRVASITGGRRHAPPRHQTLRATLDWSFETLNTEQANALEAMSVFRASFSLAAAETVIGAHPADVAAILSDLVAKSLVVAETTGGRSKLRLLEVTKAYASGKLDASPRASSVRLSHARYVSDELDEISGNTALSMPVRHEAYGALIGDIRAAIHWCFSEAGQQNLGLKVILCSAPAWVRLSLTNDYVALIEKAVARVSATSTVDTRDLLVLYAQLYKALFNAVGLVDRVERLVEDAVATASDDVNRADLIVALWTLFGARLTRGRYEEALDYGLQLAALAEQLGDEYSAVMCQRVLAVANFRLGNLRAANEHILRAHVSILAEQSAIGRDSLVYKHDVAVSAAHAGIAWLSGRAEEAAKLAQETRRVGLAAQDNLALCYALAHVLVPLAFWMDDLDLARELALELIELSRSQSLSFWTTWGRAYEAAAARLRSRACTDDFLVHAASFPLFLHHTLGTILDEFAEATPGMGLHWASAEIERRRGDLALLRGDVVEGKRALVSALCLARRQGARAWELRTVASLARAGYAEYANT